MKLRAWMWNLGVVGVAVLPACNGGKGSGDGCHATPEGYSAECYYEDDHYDDYDGYDGYDGYDDYDQVACREDADCSLGFCENPASTLSQCVAYPRIPQCEDERPLDLAWVRLGDARGRAAGVVGRSGEPQRILMTDADVGGSIAPLSIADAETGATAVELPLQLLDAETPVGLEEADLDADGEVDLLVTLANTDATRVVPLLQEDDGSYTPSDAVLFEGRLGAAKLRRDAEGGHTLYVLGENGQLLQSTSLRGGTFAAVEPSPWSAEWVRDFAVAPVQDVSSDDVVLVVQEGDDQLSRIDALIGGERFEYEQVGSWLRQIFIDPRLGYLLTVDDAGGSKVLIERFIAGQSSSLESLVSNRASGPLRSSALADLDGDGQGDIVLLHSEPELHVVFGVTSDAACVQTVEIMTDLDTVLTPSSGTGDGVVVTGPKGVLAIQRGSG